MSPNVVKKISLSLPELFNRSIPICLIHSFKVVQLLPIWSNFASDHWNCFQTWCVTVLNCPKNDILSTSLKFLKNKLVWSILLLHILFSHCLNWHSFQSCFQVMKLCNYFYSWWNYDSSNLLNFLSLSRGHFWCYHCLGNCLPVIFWHHVIQRPATMFRCI